MYTYIYTSICICVYTNIHTYIYIYICTYIYIRAAPPLSPRGVWGVGRTKSGGSASGGRTASDTGLPPYTLKGYLSYKKMHPPRTLP